MTYSFPSQTLYYSSIDDIEIEAGNGGNTFFVDDVPAASDVNPTAMSVVLSTGTASDKVTLTTTTGPVFIHGQGGNDVVNVGVPNRGTQDISGNVSVDNVYTGVLTNQHSTTLNINDTDDSTVRSVDFDTPIAGLGTIAGFVGTHTFPNPFSPPQSTTIISYQISDVGSVNAQGGNGVNTFKVFNTPRNSAPFTSKNLISTYLTLGSYLNTVQVSGTTGPLTIVGGGAGSDVYLGTSDALGNLANLLGRVTVLGTFDQLMIEDTGANGFRYYTMASDSFTGGATAGIFYPGISLNYFAVDLGDGGNQLVVKGTPAIPNSDGGSGVSISTGNGGDAVQVNASSANLSIDMGAGVFQTLAIGSNKASLDGIENVTVDAGGDTQVFVSDAAATTSQSFTIDNVISNFERVTRTDSSGATTATLNTFFIHFNDPGQVYLTAGKAGDNVTIHGTPANTTTIVNGGAGQDSVAIESDKLTPPVLGPIDFYGTASQGDLASIYAEDSLSGGSGNDTLSGGSGNDTLSGNSYIFQATPSKPFTKPNVLDQQAVRIGGDALITFRGIVNLTVNVPSVGGNFVSIQGVPSGESLNVNDASYDRIIFGNAISSPIGLMTDIRGITSINASGKSDVSVTLDDSIDSVGRHVVLYQATDGSTDLITGMSPADVRLALGTGSTVKLLGGLGNDTFALANLPLAGGGGNDFFTPPTVGIDGGQGINALDYSNVYGLSGPYGVYVNLVTGEASGLNGISRIQNVTGSAFDDILVGNGGNVLDGGAGRDLLIAGATASTLHGGNGEDLLIGGTTAYDTDQLAAVLDKWAVNLDAGSLNGQVQSNGGGNTLLGQVETDLFFMGLGNINKSDKKNDEVIVYV